MISLEQDFEQSLKRGFLFADFLDSLSGDGLRPRALAVPVEPVPVSPPAGASIAIAKGGRK